jgi:hypothetical protein
MTEGALIHPKGAPGRLSMAVGGPDYQTGPPRMQFRLASGVK